MELRTGGKYIMPPGIVVTAQPAAIAEAAFTLIDPGRWGRWHMLADGQVVTADGLAGRLVLASSVADLAIAEGASYETATLGQDPRAEFR